MDVATLKCAHCYSPMTRRKNRNTNEWFYGCKRYPECKGTRQLNGSVFRPIRAARYGDASQGWDHEYDPGRGF